MKLHTPLRLVAAAMLAAAVLLSSCNMGAAPAPTADVGAIQTQAFNTVLTQVAFDQAQTAMAQPPAAAPLDIQPEIPTLSVAPTFPPIGGGSGAPLSLSPIPGFTPLAPVVSPTAVIGTVTTKNGCNDGTYIGETKPDDGAILKAGGEYSKAWTILNVGSCPWDEGYAFVLMKEFSSSEIQWEHESIVIKQPSEVTQPQHSQTFVVKFNAPKAAGSYEAYWKLRDDGTNYFGPMVWIKFVVAK
jgi:hypothetical protein